MKAKKEFTYNGIRYEIGQHVPPGMARHQWDRGNVEPDGSPEDDDITSGVPISQLWHSENASLAQSFVDAAEDANSLAPDEPDEADKENDSDYDSQDTDE